jgi:hypothetical protein
MIHKSILNVFKHQFARKISGGPPPQGEGLENHGGTHDCGCVYLAGLQQVRKIKCFPVSGK